MRKTTRIVLIFALSLSSVFARPQSENGGKFVKRVEYKYQNNVIVELPNGKIGGMHNLDGKKDVEKLFFGDFNADVEYFLEPSFSPATGFRIYRDSLDTFYLLEVKRTANYDEVNKQVAEEFPTQGAKTFEELEGERGEQILQHNRKMWGLQRVEKLKRYQIETKVVQVSDEFAEKMHTKTFTAIDTFKAKGKPAMISDGELITFRCVVEDELWTFTIHSPYGHIRELSNLFRQIIVDVEADSFDETKYIDLLGVH